MILIVFFNVLLIRFRVFRFITEVMIYDSDGIIMFIIYGDEIFIAIFEGASFSIVYGLVSLVCEIISLLVFFSHS